MPSLAALAAFEAVCRAGTVSAAAGVLNRTQSAVSRQILGLEAQLGVALFHRRRKRLVLTEVGAAYLDEVREALGRLADATDSVAAGRGRRASVTIATLPTFGASWLVPRLPNFRRLHPDIRVKLVTHLSPFDFSSEEVDGAIHFGEADWPGAIVERLAPEEMVVAGAAPWRERLATPAQILSAPLVEVSSRPLAWREWLAVVGRDDARLDFALSVETFAMGLEAVRAGLGVGILPGFVVERAIGEGEVFAAEPRVLSRSAYYFAYPRRRSDHAALRKFAAWLSDEAGAAGGTAPGAAR